MPRRFGCSSKPKPRCVTCPILDVTVLRFSCLSGPRFREETHLHACFGKLLQLPDRCALLAVRQVDKEAGRNRMGEASFLSQLL